MPGEESKGGAGPDRASGSAAGSGSDGGSGSAAGAGSRPGLSVVVITRNEEERLADCLESVEWADEIVVVDDESTDATRGVARRFTDRVLVRPLDRFGRQKQYAIEQAAGDWILVLDADERVTDELAAEIRDAVARDDPDVDGYFVRRLTWFFGAPIRHAGWFRCNHLRLFRRGRAEFLDRRVHEYPVLEDPDRVGRLDGHLEHHTYDDWSDYLAKLDRYTRLAALDRHEAGRRIRGGPGLFPFLLQPAGVFLKKYVLRAGFLDGVRGLLVSALSAWSAFLTSARLWSLEEGDP